MEQIISIDVGGTSIKYGLWNETEQLLSAKGKVATPKDLAGFYDAIQSIVAKFADEKVDGVGFSIPGAVDQKTGVIGGISALPYIHNFPIQAELENILNLTVTMENDANCAALAEVSVGAASDMSDVIFIIIGTGIGGAVVLNRQIIHGKHLLGGEFGMILDDKNERLSLRGTVVHMAERYSADSSHKFTGQEVLELAEQGDPVAQRYTDDIYQNLARAIYNLQFVVDPEAVIIGGGVSANNGFIQKLDDEIKNLVKDVDDIKIVPTLMAAEYHNDANLIGSAYNFFNKD
ncbi:ROK family protein [Companilactobacillus muriivasis]|uniref:ROK family protein n=1 Tax=Companilactobacillus muriivasis TaxID=3081444 RepID=UPI0030C6D24A